MLEVAAEARGTCIFFSQLGLMEFDPVSDLCIRFYQRQHDRNHTQLEPNNQSLQFYDTQHNKLAIILSIIRRLCDQTCLYHDRTAGDPPETRLYGKCQPFCWNDV